MRYLLFVALLPLVAYAGQLDYERSTARAKADYDYAIKVCKAKPKAEVQQCIVDTKKTYNDALRGLREYHSRKHDAV